MTAGGLGRAVAAVAVAVAFGSGVLALRSCISLAVVDGSSMRPALEPADILLVRRGPGAPRVGDIVVFPRPGWEGGVAHRVTAVTTAGALVTRGDANPVADRDPVEPRALAGRVVARVPTGSALGAVERLTNAWMRRAPRRSRP